MNKLSPKRIIIEIILAVGDLLGLNLLFKAINSEKIRILMYHGVSSTMLPTFYWTLLDLNKFAWQMKYLKRHYNVVRAVSLLEKEREQTGRMKNGVVITFDDGVRNVYTKAWPILKNLGLPAICFVLPALSKAGRAVWTDGLYSLLMHTSHKEIDLTNYGLGKLSLNAGQGERAKVIRELSNSLKSWPHERRTQLLEHLFSNYSSGENTIHDQLNLMTVEQIIELSRSDEFQIGPHTGTHPILSTLSPDDQANEIKTSIDDIVHWGIEPAPIFAYPNGRKEDFNEQTVEILKKLKIKAAVSTIDGLHDRTDDMYYIRRIPIGADISKWEFKARLSGFFYFLQRMTGG